MIKVSLVIVTISCIIVEGFESMLQPPVEINGTAIKLPATIRKEDEVRDTAPPTLGVKENLTYNNSSATDLLGNPIPNVKSSNITDKEWWDEILKKRKEEDLQKGNQTEVHKKRKNEELQKEKQTEVHKKEKSHKQTTVHLESEGNDSLINSHYTIIPLNSSTISSIVEENKLNNDSSVKDSSSSSTSKQCRSIFCSYLVLPLSTGIYCYNLYKSVNCWNVFK